MTPISDPPIRVFLSEGYWRVDYGSYMDGFHATRVEAIARATAAAAREHRTLEIEGTRPAHRAGMSAEPSSDHRLARGERARG